MNTVYFLVGILYYTNTIKCEDTNITIPLNKSLTAGNKELYGGFYILNETSTISIEFTNINKNVSFIIFQVHSQLYNVTLYNNTFVQGSYVNGTNIGMYSAIKPMDLFYIYNPNNISFKVYISVHGYRKIDPIPGGCNMEMSVSISPYMLVQYNDDYVYLDAAPSKAFNDKYCNSMTKATVLFYKMYLPERNLEENKYFDGLRKMMTLEMIHEYGDEIPSTYSLWNMRRMLSAYRGTGTVYVAVAYTNTGYSVYVPSHTYACDPAVENSCILLGGPISQILCVILFFTGLFTCYFGHKFFKTEMFLVGMLTGVIVTYVIIALIADLDASTLLGGSLLCGLFFGAIWLLFWWFYGIPVFAVLLCTLNLGFLFASIIYYRFLGDPVIITNEMNFWTVFIIIMLVTSLTLVSVTFLSNILCCAILGAYAAVYPIDYYVGSNLKYILINILRRATVPKFNRAVLSPPFELYDALITVVWLILAITGFLFQHYHNRGRPPFPPPPRSISTWTPEASYGSFENGRYNDVIVTSPTNEVVTRNRISTSVDYQRIVDERSPLFS